MSKQLLVSRIKTPDGTILESKYTHDYREYKDSISGESYILDGGISYQRKSVNKIPAEDLSCYTDDPHERIRENFTWGTYGKKGDQERKDILLKDLSNDHLEALIKYTDDLNYYPEHINDLFVEEYLYRKLYSIYIEGGSY